MFFKRSVDTIIYSTTSWEKKKPIGYTLIVRDVGRCQHHGVFLSRALAAEGIGKRRLLLVVHENVVDCADFREEHPGGASVLGALQLGFRVANRV